MTQEQKIIFILLNFMALEGARKHLNASLPPPESFQCFKQRMQEESPPAYWKTSTGYIANAEITDDLQAFEYSWRCLKSIRNNLFHANKAREPDTPERLKFLLDWSIDFIKAVYATNGDFAQKASMIKKTLEINSV